MKETCGVRWVEWDKEDRLTSKEKFFASGTQLRKFTDKLEKKDNFQEITSYWFKEEK